MDRDRKHFPTLLIICVLSAIILFIVASILSELNKRKLKSKERSNPIEDIQMKSKISEEEQQMENYLNENQ